MLKLNRSVLVLIIAGAILLGWISAVGGAKETYGKTLVVSRIVVPPQGLSFVTPEGKTIGKIKSTEKGGFLGIYNNQGKLVATMFADATGGLLEICNNQGERVAGMAAGKTGGELGIHNNQGKPIWSAP